MKVSIVGAGVAGLTCAVELAERGVEVEVLERSASLGGAACSWHAGGMLAPWCERESAEPLVARLGQEAIGWWVDKFPGTVRNGTLVVAHARDVAELNEFAARTERFERVSRERIAELEPDLADRFSQALYFPSEAHLDPRAALEALSQRLVRLGVRVRFGVDVTPQLVRDTASANRTVICATGLAARDELTDLRGVKGEMVLLRSRELSLNRSIRVLHARLPMYVVPRADGLFMVGATMLESDDPRRVSVRSLLELLSATYALHPAFGEAEVVEIGTGVRPAFLDNLPRIRWRDGALHVNGFFRHGFLLAPALARMAADVLLQGARFPEVMDEDHPERRRA
ncbi:MAG: glycine oxidase ThiO [Gammaproteobacteria bacterium]